MITRYREGNVTVTLSGDLERIVRKALDAAAGETVRVMEQAAGEVAAKARADWYGSDGVNRKTGRSGDIEVVTTVSDSEVRVSVGSTDTTLVRVKGGRMAPRGAVIHRAGRLSLVTKFVTQGEWWEWKKARKPVGKPGTKGATDWAIQVPNPDASDGKLLLQEFIRKPMRAAIKVVTPELGRAIAARTTGGGRG